ncbi:hypothetical protein [Metaclostridioides mangenotii]|uniref:hypothetical protein n=1 Tax=Metaclostridioides mangenotii TaxID=1540 RepID=UPI000B1F8207
MGNSLLIGCAKVVIHFVVLAPKELWPVNELIEEMNEVSTKSHGKITLAEDINDAKGADVIYTDVWVSMGEENMYESRINLLKDYQVNMDMIKKTENNNVIFLHCLPAFHDLETEVGKEIYDKFGLKELEVTDEVFNSKHKHSMFLKKRRKNAHDQGYYGFYYRWCKYG